MVSHPIVGKVVVIKGFALMEIDSWVVKLEMGSPVYEGSVLVTQKNSSIQIRFHDSALLSQSANSRLCVDKYVYDPNNRENANLLFDFNKGSFRFKKGHIGDNQSDKLSIRTPTTLMGIRGTGFSVDIGPDGEKIELL
jgi:hypothetical protein